MTKQQTQTTFAEFDLLPTIYDDLEALGFETPTPVQEKCIPPALEGKDLIGLAQTGTGKTAAFGLPIIDYVGDAMETLALILAPTRELAQQTAAAIEAMGKSSGARVAVLVGGIPLREDKKAIQRWPNIIVATPGRLIDHLHSGSLSLPNVAILAVDEADRMYDMGFIPQIRQIVETLPENRQTLMFTATMPTDVEKLVRQHMRSPERIQIGLTAPAQRAEQKLYNVNEDDKVSLLLRILRESDGRVLVFVRTKRKVDRLARMVGRHHRAARIHGDRDQVARTEAMGGFKDGRYRVLIATDIAARGIDVADIEHVVNFDFPGNAEDYIHRIGRTARVAASGLASSFVTNSDHPCLKKLENLISSKLSLIKVGAGSQSKSKGEGNRTRSTRSRSRSRRRRRNPSSKG